MYQLGMLAHDDRRAVAASAEQEQGGVGPGGEAPLSRGVVRSGRSDERHR